MKFKENILPVLQIAVSLTVIVLSTLGLTGVFEHASKITTPLLGVLLLLQAGSHWGKRKGIAIFSLCAGIFVLVCSVAIIIFM